MSTLRVDFHQFNEQGEHGPHVYLQWDGERFSSNNPNRAKNALTRPITYKNADGKWVTVSGKDDPVGYMQALHLAHTGTNSASQAYEV